MSIDPEYQRLKDSAVRAMWEADQALSALNRFFSSRSLPDDPALVREMKDRVSAVARGLKHYSPRVRRQALDFVALHGYPQDVLSEISRLALADLDAEVQAVAIGLLATHHEGKADEQICRDLARIAQATDDPCVRCSVYLALCRISGLRDICQIPMDRIALSAAFDEEFVKSFLL